LVVVSKDDLFAFLYELGASWNPLIDSMDLSIFWNFRRIGDLIDSTNLNIL